jgi:FkbM family methyltransferase
MKTLKMIKRSLRMFICSLNPDYRMREKICSIAAELSSCTFAIDVGASYYPHVHWAAVRQSSNACWIAVDPNANNLEYLRYWSDLYLSRLVVVPHGLSAYDGPQTLYVTNVDSGSSLLEPTVNDDWQRRVDPSYFFPINTITIECLSLQTLLHDFAEGYLSSPMWIKLDTQGTECHILEGLSKETYRTNVIVLESECTLQRIPVMKGAGKFDRLTTFLEPMGFELVCFKPISIPIPAKQTRIKGAQGILNECDAVFMLSPTIALNCRPLIHNLSLISAYLCYSLYQEAVQHSILVLDHFSNDLSHVDSLLLRKLVNSLS